MIDKGIARHDYEIKDAAGNLIGKVTSGTQSPSLGKAIGMGYVDTAYAALGTEVFVAVRDKALQAVIVKIPFA
jgi:aminomethyltransferase